MTRHNRSGSFLGSPMLELEGIWKRYGSVEALSDVALRVDPGEIVGLVGPNGAGKTSLLSITVGLRRPDAGKVRVANLDPARDHAARRLIGYAPQTTGVYPTLNVADNLRMYGRLSGLSGKSLEARLEDTATALDLLPLLGRKAEALSGGERRRVHVAGAVIGRPPLVILDEATAGMDVDARRGLIEFLDRLRHEGAAVLFSTHYLHEIDRDDIQVVILDHGRVIASGPIGALLQRYGQSAVVLSFDGPAPDVLLPFEFRRRGSTLRVRSDAPTEVLAEVLKALGADASRLRGVEVTRPDLDGVFAELTGRPYDHSPDYPDQAADVQADVV
jgi:ABC-2 type transport system ATP-binding protein